MNASEQRARPRRRILPGIVIVCVVALVATIAYLAHERATATPQPYGGAATANDFLQRVVTDPSGGAWAIGARFDQTPTVGSDAKVVSTFIIHETQGRWVMSKSLDTSTGEYINAIAMVSADEGWAVGGVNGTSGLILHYQHGAWSEESYHPRGELNAIAMVSPTEGWAVGGMPGEDPQTGLSNVKTLLHYQHGVWTTIPSATSGILQTLAMSSASEGWAAGVTGAAQYPAFLRYTNGAWTPTPLLADVPPPNAILAIAAPSASEAWALATNGELLHFYNGAWANATNPTSATLTGISMSSVAEGWAVGDPTDSHTSLLLHYTGGAWTPVQSPTRQPLSGVAMISPRDGWAVGEGGTILHYSGSAWSIVNGAA